RKERQQKHEQQLWHEAKAEPDDEKRRDRDLRDDLEEDDDRVHRLLHEARIRDRECERNADDNGQRIAGEDLLRRHPRSRGNDVVALPEFGPDFRRRRQQVFLHPRNADRDFPRNEQQREDRERAAARAQPSRECSETVFARTRVHPPSFAVAICGSASSKMPNSAGRFTSMSSRSSERPTTLWGTPAGCDSDEPARTTTSSSTPAKRNLIHPRST